jgi:hypothetical protein
MPTGGDAASGWAVDTSVAIAYLDEAHAAHDHCVRAVGDLRPALAGHAAFECYAVLTRLPGPAQVSGVDAAAALGAPVNVRRGLLDLVRVALHGSEK